MTNKIRKILMGLAALAALALGGSALAGAASGGGSGSDQAVQERGEASEPAGSEDTDNVQDENGKDDGQDCDQGLTGDTATRASEAALAATGGGKVNASERDGEKGATYEVEITKPDGKTVDVRLDDQFKVVAVDSDGE
jgi:uncharacterized membrane protein YkoI